MCTSIISNRNKTIVGWNLDILDMDVRINETDDAVLIEVYDTKEGWLPLFGANNRGDFVGMPTCWPYDEKSDPENISDPNVIMLDIDLLTKKKSFEDIKDIAFTQKICSLPHVTYMSSLSNSNGDVLHIIPGQGYKYYQKPLYKVLTNFSPFKGEKEMHPWMGLDRFNKANQLLNEAKDDFDVDDCFDILKKVSQTVCPTVVSMVFDVTLNKVYWCLNKNFDDIKEKSFKI